MYFPFYSEYFKFVICLNGKIASTRCKEWFLKIHSLPEVPEKYRPRYSDLDALSVPNLHSVAEDIRYKLCKRNFDKVPSVLIVRNPYDRLLSYYWYWIVERKFNQDNITRKASFADLINYIYKEGSNDNHAIPQMCNLTDINFTKMISTENLAEEMQIFFEKNCDFLDRLPEKLQPKNFFAIKNNKVYYTTSKIKIKNPWNIPGTEWVRIQQRLRSNEMYNQELKDRVKEIYTIDFLYFAELKYDLHIKQRT